MDASRELILRLIDETTEPDKMDPSQAVAFLQELHADIEGRIEGLRDENPELAD
jgi:malate synthase